MAVLSKFWRDIWFSLRQLNIDHSFHSHIKKKYCYAKSDIRASASLYVINKVLMQHNGLIRKIIFNFSDLPRKRLRSRLFDINQWLLFVTQKGVQEIDLCFKPLHKYRVPNCIFSCATLRELSLWGVFIEPINGHYRLPNVTSLRFVMVDFESFDGGHLPVDVPILKNLSFKDCDNMSEFNMSEFNITAQKLDSLVIDYSRFSQFPINLDYLKSVRTLSLDSSSIKDLVNGFTRSRGLQLQPPALINVEYLKLSNDDEFMSDISSEFIHLLRICPKLCELDLDLMFSDGFSKLPELIRTVAGRHKMLHTLKVESFVGNENETCFIKGLLVCFPALEKVVIDHRPICYCNKDFENNKEEILHFPCTSTKVEIIFNVNSYSHDV